MTLTLEIVMPDGKIEHVRVKSVVFQAIDGEMGILPGHLPMLALIDVGVLRVATKDGELRFVTGQGIASVTGDRVTMLLHDLIAEEDIREDEALRDYENLSKAMSSQAWAGLPENREEQMRELRFAEARLALAGLKPR